MEEEGVGDHRARVAVVVGVDLQTDAPHPAAGQPISKTPCQKHQPYIGVGARDAASRGRVSTGSARLGGACNGCRLLLQDLNRLVDRIQVCTHPQHGQTKGESPVDQG